MDVSVQAYKQFIDGLQKFRVGLEAKHVKEGSWQGNYKYDKLLQSLTQEQREIIVEIINNARISCIHDLLVFITDQHYRLSKDSIELAIEPFGTENYFDFIARSDGELWPDEKDAI